jgi:hypothetical protein
MDSTLQAEINALITRRILAYHQSLIDGGQIREFENHGPEANRLVSDCSQSEHRLAETALRDPVPLQGAPIHSAVYDSEHE